MAAKLNLKVLLKLILIFVMSYFLSGCADESQHQKETIQVPDKVVVEIKAKTAPGEITAGAADKKEAKTVSIKNPKKESAEPIVTFIELGSVKCVPCKMMQPIMKEIENEYAGQVKVVFYDVWELGGKSYAEKYQVRAIPTQVFLDKDGKEYSRHIGFFPKEELVKVLKMQGVK